MAQRYEPAPLRLFIAFDLPGAVKDELVALQAAWQRTAGETAAVVKWVPIGGVHLTLKFLGAAPPAQVDLIRLALAQAMGGLRALRLRLAAVGVFPGPQRPRVLWVGLAGEVEALAVVQRRVEQALAPLGYPPEGRFTPHLTLGRLRDQASTAERRAVGQAVVALPAPRGASFVLDVVHVIRSELRPSGARYTSLAQVALETER
ncbi:MAG: RNA 2',3'-cyclic phosphodiesterase [Chloroflexi bacterium]|nr:RNA 2',3'-cyclic phosphodiesterase [Chloroflexota bacterium]